MTRWYRAYEGTVTDPKLGEVAMVAGCSRSVAIAAWHCILESCAVANDGGNFDATLRRVAVILGEPLQIIEAVFSELENLKMIEGSCVTSWAKRQFESDSSTARSKKHREIKAKENATGMQRCATPPDTDTDTDTEKIRDTNVSLADGLDDIGEPVEIERPKNGTKAALRQLGEKWNALASELSLPTIEEIPPGSPRERAALARIREGRDFDAIFAKIRGSPYLKGEKNGFRCTFNWMTNPTNLLKIIEGDYDEVRKRPQADQSTRILSSDDIAAANRFEERRARVEAERLGPANREMGRRVSALFEGLIAELNAKPERTPRWRGQKEPPLPLTLEQMAELWSNNPVKLSAEALEQ